MFSYIYMFFMCIHIIDIYIYACLYIQISYLYIYTLYINCHAAVPTSYLFWLFCVCGGREVYAIVSSEMATWHVLQNIYYMYICILIVPLLTKLHYKHCTWNTLSACLLALLINIYIYSDTCFCMYIKSISKTLYPSKSYIVQIYMHPFCVYE